MGRALALAICLVGCGSPALAQDAFRDAAQGALTEGDAQRAVRILEEALAGQPDDPDLLRRLAVAQAAAGDLAAALATIETASRLAPGDNDIRLARARILLWSARPEEALSQAREVQRDDPDYPELSDVIEAIERERRGRRGAGLAVAAGWSRIAFESGAHDDWESTALDAFARFDGLIVSGSLQREVRAATDTRLGLRVDRVWTGGAAYAAVALTPSPDFRETWSVSAGGELALSRSVTALADIRHAHYSAGSVSSFQPGIRLSPSDEVDLTARSILLVEADGDFKAGGSLRADYRRQSGSGLFVGGAVYPDTEAGVTRRISAVFGGATLPITETLVLRLSGEYERRDMSYSRRGVTIGLSWRFGG